MADSFLSSLRDRFLSRQVASGGGEATGALSTTVNALNSTQGAQNLARTNSLSFATNLSSEMKGFSDIMNQVGNMNGMPSLGSAISPGVQSKATQGATTAPAGGLTTGQAVGLGALSTGLELAGSIMNTRASEKDQMDAMRSQFDLAFGSQEFDHNMILAQKEFDNTLRLIETLSSVNRQGAGAEADTIASQRQRFVRDPQTGALL